MLRAWVVAGLAGLLAGAGWAQRTAFQAPCPVLLVSGSADKDRVRLSFMNKGKMPLQQVSFACAPPSHGVCHTESGLFYPGTNYAIDFAYTATTRESMTRGSIVITVTAARLGDGTTWVARRSAACRPLKILRRK